MGCIESGSVLFYIRLRSPAMIWTNAVNIPARSDAETGFRDSPCSTLIWWIGHSEMCLIWFTIFAFRLPNFDDEHAAQTKENSGDSLHD